MKLGLNAGFGERIGPSLLYTLKHHKGVQIIRQGLDIAPGADIGPGDRPVPAQDVTPLVEELVEANMEVLWLATLESLKRAPLYSHVELLNEPDLHRWSPDTYANYVYKAQILADARRCQLWIGSVSNLSRDRQEWLRQVKQRVGLHPWWTVHRYPVKNMNCYAGQKGFKSRAEEMSHLRDILGQAHVMVTEFGYHTAPFRTGWWIFTKERQFDNHTARLSLLHDLKVYREYGMDAAFVYQLQNGPTMSKGDRYGIWHKGIFLPQAEVFSLAREEEV